jgi:multidrug resistance efflux pump
MIQDQNRNIFNYQAYRLDVLVQRIDLSTARTHLRQAESELERATRLMQENILAPGVTVDGSPGYEVALRDRDALAAQVREREKVMAEMETVLEQTRPQGKPEGEPLIEDAISAAIAAHEAQIRLEDDQVLRAPADGVVTLINRRVGENIMAGEPLVQISGDRAERIIGFIRPPVTTLPQPGQRVEVRTRGYPIQKMSTEVIRVGAKLELFSQPLRLRGFGAAQERGLPILVEVPSGLRVHPGELVDLFIPRAVP